LLTGISILLVAVSIFGMILIVFVVGPGGIIGFILGAVLAASMFEAAIRIAGVRNRARQVEFLWVLAIAVKSGRPLADEIESYAQGTSGRRHRKLIEMADRLREGMPLTELVVPAGLLPPPALMQIHLGISTKSLEESLQSTALRYTQQVADDHVTPHPGTAFVYPAAMVPVVLGIVSFLMYYIIPKFKKIFDDFGTELPRLTIMLISTSDLIFNFWYLFAIPLFYVPLAIFGFVTLAEFHGWQVMSQSTFGRWFIRWYSPDILRSLAQSIMYKVPIDQSLTTMARFTRPIRLRERLIGAAGAIESGVPAWQSLYKAGILSFNETVLLETAERTGNLPFVLRTLAANLERRWSFRLHAILELLHPLLIVAVAVVVGFVVLSLFIPLVKLLNDLS
jgi:type II secretory pathway component PulF